MSKCVTCQQEYQSRRMTFFCSAPCEQAYARLCKRTKANRALARQVRDKEPKEPRIDSIYKAPWIGAKK